MSRNRGEYLYLQLSFENNDILVILNKYCGHIVGFLSENLFFIFYFFFDFMFFLGRFYDFVVKCLTHTTTNN